MKEVTYYAVFEPTNTGYSVYFPDLPGCITVGNSLEHAFEMAKESLTLHLTGTEFDNFILPKATRPPINCEPKDVVAPITVSVEDTAKVS